MNDGWGTVGDDPWRVAPVDLFAVPGLARVAMAGNATFDYVIVGAGSAGCVMANRLSAEHDVLVLEAGGPDEASEISVPAAFSELFETDVDWAYLTEPQAELDDRELYWPRGKVLGGSSSINAQIHVRGHPADYDEWAARGNDGWSWDEVEPTLRALEADDYGSPEDHGRDGPMSVHRPPVHELTQAWIDAVHEAGVSYNDDFNAGDLEGVGPFPISQKGGKRHSAADGYLKPALDRSTLQAETGAHVTEILFDDHEAVGVAYEQDGDRFEVGADREVIVCGGAINSPQLLMCSGVGPADHLAEHGIDVVANRPGVGRNLQDHLQVGMVFEVSGTDTLDSADGLLNLAKYLLLKRGPLTSNVAEAGAFVRSSDDLDAPDLEFHLARSHYIDHGLGNPDEGQALSFSPCLLTAESRGEIRLASADPFEHPEIDPQYLTEGDDLERLVAGLRLAVEIAEAAPLDPYRGERVWPDGAFDTDEALEARIRETAETIYHPVGTCKMGDDEMAVVDDDCRVHGVKGLRVVDASVMPTITRGNTNIPTIMIAERAAEFVRSAA
jgi:choline dehydrogenase